MLEAATERSDNPFFNLNAPEDAAAAKRIAMQHAERTSFGRCSNGSSSPAATPQRLIGPVFSS
jgi:hypothetical protein